MESRQDREFVPFLLTNRSQGCQDVLFARKAKRFADEFIGGPEAGLCQEVVDDRCYGMQEPIALCANKNAQDSDRGETKFDGDGAPVRLVDEDPIRADLQCEGEGLGFTGIEIGVARNRCRDGFRQLNPNPFGKGQTGEAPGGLCETDKLGLDGGRNHNLMENGIQQVLVPDQREIENDRGVRDNDHTPRMRSMAARSLCRSLTE